MFKITEYFSFYVLLWYFLYMLNIIPFNPIISFYLILSFVSWLICYMIYLNISTKKILYFILIGVIFAKIIPILTLKHVFNPIDLVFGYSMFFIYYIILYYTKKVEPIQHYFNFVIYLQKLPDNFSILDLIKNLIRIS
jgi:hypothetical protein